MQGRVIVNIFLSPLLCCLNRSTGRNKHYQSTKNQCNSEIFHFFTSQLPKYLDIKAFALSGLASLTRTRPSLNAVSSLKTKQKPASFIGAIFFNFSFVFL